MTRSTHYIYKDKNKENDNQNRTIMITLPHLGLSHPQLLPYPSFQYKLSNFGLSRLPLIPYPSAQGQLVVVVLVPIVAVLVPVVVRRN